MKPWLPPVLLLTSVGAVAVSGGAGEWQERAGSPSLEDRTAHLDRVRRADFCAACHPEATAEHRMNTHGRAFTDPEVRLATAQFSIPGCIDCHTPRPIFETGIGMNPIKRNHHLEEGNDCLSCHAKAGYDFSAFRGGDECRAAFDDRVGTVEACASCHRNHGTPYQWENAEFGKKAGNVCIDCHMPEVVRPVAVGLPPRTTRRHTFFGGRSSSQLEMAHDYSVELDGNEVVVHVKNAGAGHNFPTELKQRSVESLVVVRDAAGREVARSRQVYRDPYKRPYGLTLPVNTQIPSGASREHRVPLPVAAGTVETTLYYKLYYPIEDGHPDLSRILQRRSLAFGPVEPSMKPIPSDPEVRAVLPEAMPAAAASPGNLADFARPKIGKVEVTIPEGKDDAEIEQLIALFQFPVGEANKKAGDTLVALGERAVPALVKALGSWDNKTWMQAQGALLRIGKPAVPAVVQAMESPELYIRFHAREILSRMDAAALAEAGVVKALIRNLREGAPLDRRSAADAAADLRAKECIPALRSLLTDLDFDVVASAARALGALGDRESIPTLVAALARVRRVLETARDVAWGMAALGDPRGGDFLLEGLDATDDLVRLSCFEAWLDVTGVSKGYTALLPFEERTAALAELRAAWAQGRERMLRAPRSLAATPQQRAEAERLVKEAGGNDVAAPDAALTEKAIARLVELGPAVLPQVLAGLKWPSGFVEKRVALLRALCQVPDSDAVPTLLETLRDPSLTTALWAAQALEHTRDPAALPHLRRLEQRFDEAAIALRVPPSLGHPEDTRVLLGRARMRLGDEEGARLLLRLLYSQEPTARAGAEAALRAALEDPALVRMASRVKIAEELEAMPSKLAALARAMRETWQRNVEAAENLQERAETREQILEALAQFDFAEEACTRYYALDERAFAIDLRRTTSGADDLSQRLFEDAAFRDSIVARNLLSPVERRGMSQSAGGILTRFEGDRWVLEAPADGPGGFVNFGLGGPGGMATPMEWWRDYELLFDVKIERQGLWILDRYDPIWAIFHRTALTVEAPEEAGVLHVPVREGETYEVRHAAIASDVVHVQRAKGVDGGTTGDAEFRASMPGTVRKGGLVLQLTPGAKVSIGRLRVKIYRSDAAEAVNAVLATPGR